MPKNDCGDNLEHCGSSRDWSCSHNYFAKKQLASLFMVYLALSPITLQVIDWSSKAISLNRTLNGESHQKLIACIFHKPDQIMSKLALEWPASYGEIPILFVSACFNVQVVSSILILIILVVYRVLKSSASHSHPHTAMNNQMVLVPPPL